MSRILQDIPSTKEKRKILKNNQTKAEEKLWNILRNRQFMGLKFRRQHGIGEYIADFYCAEKQIIIEIDGDSHFKEEAIEYDRIRTEFINELGIRVIRVTNIDVYENIEGVLERLTEELNN